DEAGRLVRAALQQRLPLGSPVEVLGRHPQMAMTPLNVPWGKKAPIPKEPERPPVPVFLGVTNERVKDQAPIENDPTAITIQVNGVKGVPNNTFKVRWSKGTAL